MGLFYQCSITKVYPKNVGYDIILFTDDYLSISNLCLLVCF